LFGDIYLWNHKKAAANVGAFRFGNHLSISFEKNMENFYFSIDKQKLL